MRAFNGALKSLVKMLGRLLKNRLIMVGVAILLQILWWVIFVERLTRYSIYINVFFRVISILILLAVLAVVALVWYWPRFKVEWEYVFCDGQLDFDRIQGGEKRKTILRIELENADVIAPMHSHRMDGYRHLPVRDFSSLQPDAKPYGIAIREEGKEEKVVLLFEPSKKMIDLICNKFPGKTELAD